MITVKAVLLVPIFLLFFGQPIYSNSNDSFIDIIVSVEPNIITIGKEGVLKIKVVPNTAVRISSSPEFVVRLSDSDENVVFTKNFFTASELEFKTVQEGKNVFLNLNKEILIPFKVIAPYPGTHKISGKIIFTAIEKKDNWSIKTFNTFSTYFKSELKKKKRYIRRKKTNRKNK